MGQISVLLPREGITVASATTPGKRTIVVGIDGSSSSAAALQLAASLMPLAGDTLRAIAVWQYPLAFGLDTPLGYDFQDLAGQAIDQAVADAFPDGSPYPVERSVIHGVAAEVLIKESRSASMIVIGSRGHGGFSGILLGSVSSAVAERSSCPVLVSHGALEDNNRELADGSPARVSA